MIGDKRLLHKRPQGPCNRSDRKLTHYGLPDDKSKVFCVTVRSFVIAIMEGQES